MVIAICSHAQDPAYPAAPAAPQNITAAEYFIDNDPGIGSAITLPVSAATNISNANVAINVNGLTNGVHHLYIRTMSAEGHWSVSSEKDFLYDVTVAYSLPPAAAQNVVSAEYFIDSDPGIGLGTVIPITPGIDLANINTAINTAGLANGAHRLYVRTKSQEGRWSLTTMKDFVVNLDYPYPASPAPPQNIVAAEYFIDTDPGIGGGAVLSITPGLDLSSQIAVINTAGLSNGIHQLYIRTKSSEGHWSLTANSSFAVSAEIAYPAQPAPPQNIVAGEYFIDTDPGPGLATAVSIPVGNNLSNLSYAVNTTGLSNGTHYFSLRTRSQEGRWSLTNVQPFAVSDTVHVFAWTISPPTGHDYQTVATGTPSVFNFHIRNTGNTSITLDQVQSDNAAFVPTFTSGAIITAGDSLTIPVRFTPTTVGAYTGQLSISSSTAGVSPATAPLTGTGYTPGVPPVLRFVTAGPYAGLGGVSPAAGQTGDYTYKIVYQSPTGRPPMAGYPQVGIDRNGDGDFNDAGEGIFTMTRDGSGTDYTAGVTYTYTINHPDYSNTLGYKFFAQDNQGNAATAVNAGYLAGPIVTYQLLDLKIFASDISFSKNNPQPGETFTLTANVTNSSAFNAVNVPVRFYRDTILLDSAVIPSVRAFATGTVTKNFSFAADGYYPIKVWIDSANTLGDANPLNNYAIRPVTVGNVTLPGGINITAAPTLQSCPQALVITGTAKYYGTTSPSIVAGAQVTITVGSQTYTTATDGSGNYRFLLQNPTCGGTQVFTVSVTDFTFTSQTLNGSINIPCPAPNACGTPPSPPPTLAIEDNNPCALVRGKTSTVDITLYYNVQDRSNRWAFYDRIIWDSTYVWFHDSLVYSTGLPPGAYPQGVNTSVNLPPLHLKLDSTGPNKIRVWHRYIYNEFDTIPGFDYAGRFLTYVDDKTFTINVQPDLPDLVIRNFTQPAYTTFQFDEGNLTCTDAGPHTVQLWDSLPGGTKTLLHEYPLTSLAGAALEQMTFSNTSMSTGTHYLTIIADAGGSVNELNENNNVFSVVVVVPTPDLTITAVTPVTTALSPGTKVAFNAVLKNTGTAAGTFKVQFAANGVPIGNKIIVPGVNEKGSLTVTSDPYTVTTSDRDCPVIITATADIDAEVNEPKNNNTFTLPLGADLTSYMTPAESGSSGNPVIVRSNADPEYHPLIRNIGSRDIGGASVKYVLNGVTIGTDSIGYLRAGEIYAVPGVFHYLFTQPGNYQVKVMVDTANTICESNETNNTGSFYIRVVQSNPDFQVLSQYISPSSLNPNPGQAITIVGTVKNVGLKTTYPNKLRFLVDGVQLGDDVPVNALISGQDTTVAATTTYFSDVTGVKVMEIKIDPADTAVEENKNNNDATRALIVGDAPDMTYAHANAISFNSGFRAGDSVLIYYVVKNKGAQQGTARVRFSIYDDIGALTAIDSVSFTLAAGDTLIVSKKMEFSVNSGTVVAEITGCSPMEFDLLNNTDSLSFSNVVHLKANIVVDGDLDMDEGLRPQLPGWIGGKIVLGDYDLVVNGHILHSDTAHFIITDGAGRLRFVNGDAVNTFPVGTSLSHYSFAKISNTGTPDNFSVRVLPYVLTNGTGGDTIKTENVDLTWLIEEQTPGGSNATVQLSWLSSDELPGFLGGQSRIAHYTTKWETGDAGVATQDSLGIYSWQQGGYTSFSPFTVTSGTGAALPLHLLDFNVTSLGNTAVVSWQTADEANTSRFVIQHSADGQHFADIGTVAADNTAGIHDYQFIHDSLSEGVNYYRLRMIDLDENYTWSPIRAIQWDPIHVLQAFPNPAYRSIHIKGMEAGGILQLVSFDGKLVQQYITSGSTLTIDVSHLAAGMYIINYNNHGKSQQQKIIKE